MNTGTRIVQKSGRLALGEGFEVDAQELVTGRTLLASISRYGKSYCARRICEQLFGQAGIGIIDIEGEYSTLLELYPFLIIGRDVPVEPEAAAFLADEVLKNKLSFIIDGSSPDLDAATFQEFIASFVNRFIAVETQAKTPYLFVLEEATDLVPEKGVGSSLCLQELTRLVVKGGKRGLGTLIITQRPAFVSKRIISQATNKLIGRIEWPDDIAVLRKFGQIPDSAEIHKLEQGYFYAAGPFAKKAQIVHIGPVKTTHLGATPSIIPPTPSELTEVVSRLAAKLPKVIEAMKPVIPKASEIEQRVREKLDTEWKVRLQRAEKQRDGIKAKVEAQYQAQIAELERKLGEATRRAAMAGPVGEILEHPLVKKNLDKLNPRQRSLVELLERKGPQDSDHLSLFLEVKPGRVPGFVHEVNRKIAGLVENIGGKYVSRLAQLFPVTEDALSAQTAQQAQLTQIEDLTQDLKRAEAALRASQGSHDEMVKRYSDLQRENASLRTRLEESEAQLKATIAGVAPVGALVSSGPPAPTAPSAPSARSAPRASSQPSPADSSEAPGEVQVAVTLKRRLADFSVDVSRETFVVDESSWTGKVLASGLAGFFEEPRGFGAVMAELERVYNASRTSGGTRAQVQKSLEDLCSKGILERDKKDNQWAYKATSEFAGRVKKAQEGV